MPVDPPITRATKKREDQEKGMANTDPDKVPLTGAQEGDRSDQQPEVESSDSDAAIPALVTKSGRRNTKKKRKADNKNEKRFQRLETLMGQLLQNQIAARTPQQATPVHTLSWQPNQDPAMFGLPQPVMTAPRETPHRAPRCTRSHRGGPYCGSTQASGACVPGK